MGASAVLLAETTTTSGGMEAITGGVTSLGTVVTSVFGMITGNPLLVVFLAAGLIGTAVAVFKKLKGASGGKN